MGEKGRRTFQRNPSHHREARPIRWVENLVTQTGRALRGANGRLDDRSVTKFITGTSP